MFVINKVRLYVNVAHLYYRMYARNGCKGTGFHRNEQFIAWIFARWLKLFNIMIYGQTFCVLCCPVFIVNSLGFQFMANHAVI